MLKQRILEILFWSFLASGLTAMACLEQTDKPCQQQSYTEGHDIKNKPLLQIIFPDPISFFNFLLVIVTLFLVVIGIKQANAAKKAAEAASDSAKAFVAIERGRMFVGEFKLTKKAENDPQPIIDYTFINVGRGSVVVIQVSAECELIGTQISRDVTFDPTKAYDTHNAVGPGATIGTSTKPVFLLPFPPFTIPLAVGDYANIAAKKAWIMVKGFIRYRIEFDDIYRRNFALVYGAGGFFSDVNVPGYNEEYREPKQK